MLIIFLFFPLLWSSALLSVLVLIFLLLSFSVQFLFREVVLPHCRFKCHKIPDTWYHSKNDDRPKNCTTGTMIEQKGVSGASSPVPGPLGRRTQPFLSPASESSHPLRFRATQASTPDRDADCESCVAPDSPNLSNAEIFRKVRKTTFSRSPPGQSLCQWRQKGVSRPNIQAALPPTFTTHSSKTRRRIDFGLVAIF